MYDPVLRALPSLRHSSLGERHLGAHRCNHRLPVFQQDAHRLQREAGRPRVRTLHRRQGQRSVTPLPSAACASCPGSLFHGSASLMYHLCSEEPAMASLQRPSMLSLLGSLTVHIYYLPHCPRWVLILPRTACRASSVLSHCWPSNHSVQRVPAYCPALRG